MLLSFLLSKLSCLQFSYHCCSVVSVSTGADRFLADILSGSWSHLRRISADRFVDIGKWCQCSLLPNFSINQIIDPIIGQVPISLLWLPMLFVTALDSGCVHKLTCQSISLSVCNQLSTRKTNKFCKKRESWKPCRS